MTFDRELRGAVRRLPPDVAVWTSRAIRSGWFSLAPGVYEDGGPGGAVCPIAAGATMAGAWVNGGIAEGHEAWGTPQGPSPEVEDFAAYFDLCAEEAGIRTEPHRSGRRRRPRPHRSHP
ncbi:MAG: hypothetical protein ACREX8_02540, partial [Gammaproteobacteria bacterium]